MNLEMCPNIIFNNYFILRHKVCLAPAQPLCLTYAPTDGSVTFYKNRLFSSVNWCIIVSMHHRKWLFSTALVVYIEKLEFFWDLTLRFLYSIESFPSIHIFNSFYFFVISKLFFIFLDKSMLAQSYDSLDTYTLKIFFAALNSEILLILFQLFYINTSKQVKQFPTYLNISFLF